jgi:hypothetical protein
MSSTERLGLWPDREWADTGTTCRNCSLRHAARTYRKHLKFEGSEADIKALRAPAPAPRPQAITPPPRHAAFPLEPQAQPAGS